MSEPQPKRQRAAPKLQLYYFNVDGKGEPLRLMMKHAGLDFENVFLTFEEFGEMKASGELAFGQVPMLKVDGATQLVQTHAIARYLARVSGDKSLYPEELLLAAKVDAVVDQVGDVMTAILPATYQERFGFDKALGGAGGEGSKQVSSALRETIMPRHLGFFEKLLEASGTGWLAGTEGPSMADFLVATLLKQLPGMKVWGDGGAPELLTAEKYPKVVAFREKLYGLPAASK